MQTIEQQAMERVQKARSELIFARKFYGVLVSNIEPVIERSNNPTAATNGKKHLWNPEFVMSLKKNHLGVEVAPQLLVLGVQAHESEHDARHHGTRRNGRDPVEWNICCDYSINIDLIDEGFHLPFGALIDAKYRGWSAEDIFRARELDRQKEQPKPEPEQDDADEDEGDDEQPGGDSGDETPDSDEPCDEPGDEQGDDAEGDGGEGEGDEAGDEPGQGAGAGAGEGEGEGEGEGTGEGGDAPGEAGSGAGEPGEGEGEGAGQPSFEGNFGEVLDSDVTDEHDAAEENARWEKIVRQAASVAKAAGQLPGHISREIEKANNPPRDWRDELREFAEQGALKIETWNKPNRRFVGRGMILPGSQRDGVNKAAFIIDTSGSCDHVALALVNDEAQALLDDGIVSEVVVVYGDVAVTRVDEYCTSDEIEFDPRGGGGTVLQPLFDYVAEEHSDATLIVCFTDLGLYGGDLEGDAPAVPVLFAVHGYPDRVKKLITKAPWSSRAIDVGAH
jgi:predicted metal-dependent peptidase